MPDAWLYDFYFEPWMEVMEFNVDSSASGKNDRIGALISKLVGDDPVYAEKYAKIRHISSKVTVPEYHLTNACNIRCKGCWFFEYGFLITHHPQPTSGMA